MATQSIGDITGRIRIDNVARALGSNFGHFRSKYGICGLCRVGDSRVDFLAVVADRPGRGAFGRMIDALKASADVIAVYEVLNARLCRFLERQGFAIEDAAGIGETVKAYVWRKPT